MTQNPERVRVAVPVPVGDGFDYRWDRPEPAPVPGVRVRVPFGNRQRIGIVIDAQGPSGVADSALKTITDVLDPEPLFADELLRSLKWAAGYYHYPIGEVLFQALPGLLREGRSAAPAPEPAWTLTASGLAVDLEALRRKAPRQAEALERLTAAGSVTASELRQAGVSGPTLRRLLDHDWIAAAAAPLVKSPRAATAAPTVRRS